MTDLINHEAERAVVGAVLSQPDTIAQLADALPAEAFDSVRYRRIYQAMLRLWERKTPATLITVPAELMAMGGKDRTVFEDDVLDLLTDTDWTKAAYVLKHVPTILDLAGRRAAVDAGAALVKSAHDLSVPIDIDMTAADLRRRVEAFQPKDDEPLLLADQMEAFREKTLRRWSGEWVETVASTGITRLDRMMAGGLRGGQLMYLAARPSMGKTALLLEMARRARSVIFSLEMPREDLLNRLASTLAGVSFDVAMDPNLLMEVEKRDALRNRWLDASYEVQTWPLTIVDNVWDTRGMRRVVDRLRQAGDLDAIYVDHVGKVNDVIPKASLYERTSEVSSRLKFMAMDTKLPVIAAAQLNREVDSRPGCLPYLSDLRDSGKLEEDAHVVALMYRRKYYVDKGMVNESPDDDWIHPTRGEPSWQKVSINLAKNRNGEHGIIELGWEAKAMRYHEVAA